MSGFTARASPNAPNFVHAYFLSSAEPALSLFARFLISTLLAMTSAPPVTELYAIIRGVAVLL